MFTSVLYDDVEIPNFITITNVSVQVLPNIENNFLSAPRMVGAIDAGHSLGTKIISLDFLIKDKSIGAVEKSELLAEWLRIDDLKARKLVLPSHRGSYYIAKPNNSINLTDNITTYKGTIEFICINPYRFSDILMNVEGTKVIYAGSINTDPVLVLNVTSNCETIKLEIKNRTYDNFINLIGPFVVGDVIKIDLSTSKLYKNDVEDMSLWGLNSNKHKLCKGINEYSLNNATLLIQYREVYA